MTDIDAVLDLIRQAIVEDNSQNYAQAYTLYKSAIALMIPILKCTLYLANISPQLKEVLVRKTKEWLSRAEVLRSG